MIGRGVPVPISYAENTFSVYVLSEHGLLGGIAVLLLYVWVVLVVVLYTWRVSRGEANGAERQPVDDSPLAVVVGGALMLTIPAAYVAASNLGIVPLTGQNMPFLGLNAWSDVSFVGAMISAMVVALWRAEGTNGATHDDAEDAVSRRRVAKPSRRRPRSRESAARREARLSVVGAGWARVSPVDSRRLHRVRRGAAALHALEHGAPRPHLRHALRRAARRADRRAGSSAPARDPRRPGRRPGPCAKRLHHRHLRHARRRSDDISEPRAWRISPRRDRPLQCDSSSERLDAVRRGHLTGGSVMDLRAAENPSIFRTEIRALDDAHGERDSIVLAERAVPYGLRVPSPFDAARLVAVTTREWSRRLGWISAKGHTIRTRQRHIPGVPPCPFRAVKDSVYVECTAPGSPFAQLVLRFPDRLGETGTATLFTGERTLYDGKQLPSRRAVPIGTGGMFQFHSRVLSAAIACAPSR